MLLPVACSSNAESSAASPEEIERARVVGRTLAEARCACTELQQYIASEDVCVEWEVRHWEELVIPRVRVGRMALRDEGLDRCLSLLRSCALQGYGEPPCADLFEGKLTLGTTCINDLECETHNCGDADDQCPDGFLGRCAPRVAGEGFCASNGPCEDGLTCQGSGCYPAKEPGDPCAFMFPTTTGCSPGLVCVPTDGAYLCGTQRAAGEACGVDEGSGWSVGFAACEEGLLCSTTGFRCEEPPAPVAWQGLGEACVASGAATVTCGFDTICVTGECALPRRAGESCSAGDECSSYYCRGGTCQSALDRLDCPADR